MNNLYIKSLFLILSFSMAAFFGCKKDREPAAEAKPSVSIGSPYDGSTFKYGDTLFVKASVMHKEHIHEVAVTIKRAGSDSSVFGFEKHADAMEFMVDTFWVNTFSAGGDFRLTVSASDHEGNIGTQNVGFHCLHR